MIFAAGFGTRMRPLTDKVPKPLVRIGDTTLLDHTLGLARLAKLGNIVVNAHYLSDQIESHLAGTDCHVISESEILDTGGGLKNAAHKFTGEYVITSNSDNIWRGENPFQVLCQNARSETTLLVAQKDAVLGRNGPGDFDLSSKGHLTRGGDYVFLGVQIIELGPIISFNENIFSLNVIWDQLIAENRLFGVPYDGTWCDVGRPENIEMAKDLLKDTPL